jgi:phosphohistidine swiveling domain-containing protein
MIMSFTTSGMPPVGRVGGKALELLRLTAEGFSVPPGFVLETEFFRPWMEELAGVPEWARILAGAGDGLRESADSLKRRCGGLALDAGRRRALDDALSGLVGSGPRHLYAVRSSSPEEDLEQASFAGAYETRLAVPGEKLETAIQACFASCFDERIFRYKRHKGLSVEHPSIAVIVQEFIDADAAGVAFSLNPRNNCYDEAVINANFGLGESVVSGEVEPDEFVIDKVSRNPISERIGSKEHRSAPAVNGGVEKHPRIGPNSACISLKDREAIIDILMNIEARRGEPVDIEWAIHHGKVFLLQARPITTWLPLPRIMVTEPGAPKRLYSNSTLIEQGVQEPLSVLGTDFLGHVLENVGGPIAKGAIGHDGLTFTADGGYYLNVSYAMMMGMKGAALAPGNFGDPRIMEILDGMDMRQYTGGGLPPKMKTFRRRTLFAAAPLLRSVLDAYLHPDRVLQAYRSALPEEDRRLETFSGQGMSLRARAEALTGLLQFFYGEHGIPMILAAQFAQRRIKALFKREADQVRDHLVNLGIALPGNKTAAMGEEMYLLASSPEFRRFDDPAAFLAAVEGGDLTPDFTSRWRHFLREYGMRCPVEIDPATPRVNEHPEKLFVQLKAMSSGTGGAHPFFDDARAKRESAFRALLDIASKRSAARARALSKYYKTWLTFGGYRETPKHYVIKVVATFRRQVLSIARDFAAAGRLDSPGQIFNLTIDDIDRGAADRSLDLRALGRERSALIDRMKRSRVAVRIIDSRGKIYFPPRKVGEDGVLSGVPISPGVAKGRVKVLTSATDKRLLHGEILVARATDPGWTPLFINAAGIILEVGGVLQHGAVVAREYGIPCVSGVDDATDVLKDGQTVEIDGSSGWVRVLDGDPGNQ